MLHLFPSRTIALELFGFSVHWYGVMYLLAFLLAWHLLPRLQRQRGLHLSEDEWSSILAWTVLGVIAGGRLGFVLFYEPAYFLQHPLDVFAVWHGGMSSHGGLIGVVLALMVALRHRRDQWLKIADIVVIPAALGLMLGRIGNFINQELYGTVTSLPWGIAVPGEVGLRHPTQIYAALKDLFIAGACYWHLTKVKPVRPGRTFALFLLLYAVLRFLLEYLRAQDYAFIDFGLFQLSIGQFLTIPVFAAGIALWRWTEK